MRYFIDIVRQLCEANSPFPNDIEGQFTIGPIHYDQRNGLGSVSDNANIKYLGFAAFMTPSMFLRLAAPRPEPTEFVVDAIKEGKPIGSPFLDFSFNKKGVAQVGSHEGRSRMMVIKKLYGEVPVLVNLFPRGGDRARHLTLEKIASFRMQAIAEKSTSYVVGPNFSKQVWWLDGWKTI